VLSLLVTLVGTREALLGMRCLRTFQAKQRVIGHWGLETLLTQALDDGVEDNTDNLLHEVSTPMHGFTYHGATATGRYQEGRIIRMLAWVTIAHPRGGTLTWLDRSGSMIPIFVK
jgi:hypothetical protein